MLDITTLAAWGEFIGGIAVVVSLVYLASQIRQNSRLLRVSTAAVIGESSIAVTGELTQSPELARIFWEGIADRAALSEADQQRFDPLVSQNISRMCLEYHLWQEGAVIPVLWETRRKQISWLIENPGVQHWWREWRRIYDEQFCDFIDGLIREGEAAG